MDEKNLSERIEDELRIIVEHMEDQNEDDARNQGNFPEDQVGQ